MAVNLLLDPEDYPVNLPILWSNSHGFCQVLQGCVKTAGLSVRLGLSVVGLETESVKLAKQSYRTKYVFLIFLYIVPSIS